MSQPTRLVEVRQHVLKQNDLVARALRGRFRAAGTYVVNLVSSPGAGKTAFLEKVLGLLRPDFRVAALVGDLATDNDAVRLARSQVPVRQITTGTVCHLEAAMVGQTLEGGSRPGNRERLSARRTVGPRTTWPTGLGQVVRGPNRLSLWTLRRVGDHLAKRPRDWPNGPRLPHHAGLRPYRGER
jgi:hypothetical protein